MGKVFGGVFSTELTCVTIYLADARRAVDHVPNYCMPSRDCVRVRFIVQKSQLAWGCHIARTMVWRAGLAGAVFTLDSCSFVQKCVRRFSIARTEYLPPTRWPSFDNGIFLCKIVYNLCRYPNNVYVRSSVETASCVLSFHCYRLASAH